MDEVWHSPLVKSFALSSNVVFGAFVVLKGQGVRAVVRNHTQENSSRMYWRRTFYFPGKSPRFFNSILEHGADNEVIEYIRFGFGLRLRVTAS